MPIFNDTFEKFWNSAQYLIAPMIKSDHNYNGELNQWHMEGTVWTHTCMVYNNLRYIVTDKEFPDSFYIKLLLCALLHDCGKPIALETITYKDNRTVNRFKGHATISARLAFIYLYNHKDLYNLTADDIIDIMIVITYHDIYYQLKDISKLYSYLNYNPAIFLLYALLAKADHDGQIRKPCNCDQGEIDLITSTYTEQVVRTNDKKLILMVGLPASGKDTIIRNEYSDIPMVGYDDIRIERYKNNNTGWEDLSYDDLYKKTYEWCGKVQLDVRAILHDTVRDLFNSGEKTVIINNTNVSSKVRKYFKGLARECKVNYECVCIMTSTVNAIDRNINRSSPHEDSKTIPSDVITDMWKRFIIPTMKEEFDNIRYIIN